LESLENIYFLFYIFFGECIVLFLETIIYIFLINNYRKKINNLNKLKIKKEIDNIVK